MEKPKFVNVYTESSPNPNSQKFVFNFHLLENMSFDFPNAEGTQNCPIAKALFEKFDFVQGVFIASNFITITKNASTDWYEHNSTIKEFLKSYIQDEKPLFLEGIKQEVAKQDIKTSSTETPTDAQIKAVLNDYVRPAVESDGGAISFHSFHEGVVKVLLQGSCSGCPSSTLTLKAGIENLLTRMVPEVKEVIAEGV